MKVFSFIVFTLLIGINCNAQKLSFTVDGIENDTVNLARYLGNKLYYADTVVAKNGTAVFDGSKHEGGLMAFVTKEGRYFEFILDNEEVAMKCTNVQDMVGSMSVSKSENNKVFYDYIHFMTAKKRENAKEMEAIKAHKKDSPEYNKSKEKIEAIDKEIEDYQKKLVADNGDRFIAVLVKMSMDIELPELPRDDKGNVTDSNYVYNYYINHYWDNVPLKDERIVRTPIYQNKLEKYYAKRGGILQIPDTITKYTKLFLDKMDQDKDKNVLFQFTVNYITNKYEESNIMGMDRVFVYMARNYYCAPNDKAWWVKQEQQDKICERADKIGRTMIGEYAPMLILPDSTEDKWINSYKLDAEYTILYFWDPKCGHCKKVTPKLQTLYEKKFKERNVEIYAVGKATGDDFERWKEYIVENKLTFINVGLTKNVYNQALEDPRPLLEKTTLQSLNYSDTYDIYSTPRIFILDKDKKIIFKQLSISQLEEIIDKKTGHDDDEKIFPIEEEPEDEKPENH
ncbi:MAG: DUF5106 domain-containing protein [Flavobacteriales bacterium]|nr:DUF5106 domain-containing protein [Flavobacteriales bacterium]